MQLTKQDVWLRHKPDETTVWCVCLHQIENGPIQCTPIRRQRNNSIEDEEFRSTEGGSNERVSCQLPASIPFNSRQTDLLCFFIKAGGSIVLKLEQ